MAGLSCAMVRVAGKGRHFRHQERLLGKLGDKVTQPAVDRIVVDNLQFHPRHK